MPFGKKSDGQGRLIDFDAVYEQIIKPAAIAAELDPIRADEELTGGIIHKPMFERLILCPFAVADLTLANANVYYELGVRHAARPYSTVAIFAEATKLPFDVAMLRCLPYPLQPDGTLADVERARETLSRMLSEARKGVDDSPVFQLIDLPWRQSLDLLAHEKTDVFREQAEYSKKRKQELTDARAAGRAAVEAAEQDIKRTAGSLANEEVGVVIDLFLSYRSIKEWADMIRLAAEMPPPLARTVMVQEQLALALNREAGERVKQGDGKGAKALRERAIAILNELISKRGPDSETNGILGRVYKDCWDEAQSAGNTAAAVGWLRKAINAYLDGFEADWRDAYPGINAITLMELLNPPDDRQAQLIPVVAYSVERKIALKQPDYWDYATRLELAVLARDRDRATTALSDALAHQRELWEPETTARNLGLIRDARQRRGDDVGWLTNIEEQLIRASGTAQP
jgi:hypothetical protein